MLGRGLTREGALYDTQRAREEKGRVEAPEVQGDATRDKERYKFTCLKHKTNFQKPMIVHREHQRVCVLNATVEYLIHKVFD